MKRILILISIASFMAACGQSSSTDKKTELEKLKKEQIELSKKISDLQDEIEKEDPEGNKKVRYVKLDTIKTGEFLHYVEVQGNVTSDQNVNILPRAMGPVIKVNVKVGDKVSKGQVLAVIDDAMIRKNLDEMNTRLELAITVFNKQKNLWDQKIGTEIQFLQAKNNKEALEKSIETVREQLDMTRIKSPISGMVDEVNVREGEMASNMVPAFRVVNSNELKAAGELSETYLSSVGTGDEVIVFFPDIKKEVKSKISFAARSISEQSRTFKVEVKLNDNKELRPNMLAVLKIVDYKSKDATTIPMNVIQNDQAGSYVFVAENNGDKFTVKKRSIKTGKIYNGKAEVTEGLKVGEKIITVGFQDLNEGDLVKIN